MRAIARIVPALAAVVLTAAPALAEYVVFTDGRALRVRSYRFEGSETAVELTGGGTMRFSSEVVRYVAPEDDVLMAPVTVAARARRGGVAAAPGFGAWTAFAHPGYIDTIEQAGQRYQVDPALVAAVIKAESDFRPNAVSPKGAKGLMQLMPVVASQYGVADPFDPVRNIDAGTAYLGSLLVRYGGDVERALAAYNAGPTAVDRAQGVPAYSETREYVARVLGIARQAF